MSTPEEETGMHPGVEILVRVLTLFLYDLYKLLKRRKKKKEHTCPKETTLKSGQPTGISERPTTRSGTSSTHQEEQSSSPSLESPSASQPGDSTSDSQEQDENEEL